MKGVPTLRSGDAFRYFCFYPGCLLALLLIGALAALQPVEPQNQPQGPIAPGIYGHRLE